MQLINKNSRRLIKNALPLILSLYMIVLALPIRSYGNNLGIITEKKATYSTISAFENPNLESLKQLSILLTLIIIMLVFLSVILWKRNTVLDYETLQIKSKLSQYETVADSGKDLKQIQEEHKHQALILNERQQKIVDLLAFGYSNKQIADKLFISENTVKYHIKNIYHVLHVKDRKALWLSQS